MGKLFPRFYDIAMTPLENTRFKKIRESLVSIASGRVLEIGSGTGVNFPYYKSGVQVDAIEPNPLMMNQTEKRIKAAQVPIKTHLAKAENLPFADDSFDTVVATLVFCTIPDPVKALQEIKRVSKPGAKFLLFEHVRLDKELMGKTQDLLTPAWKKICDGCHLNRDTVSLLRNAGIPITKVNSFYGGLFLTIECGIEKE
ncbi:class I SAM-dependent methyltransferase [Planococcus shixiaomingii]|uniref:class I SAM-dependent methyltransferase n=1 Tax=Planococcus shixiaomingii TaxID=3058393 RepID=UPI0026164AB4|nr:class I SAM-dependent methyltransferase [Planococcus sp. N022]WKA53096.1 class I SAM-dependent methyltransferase [Planococcus sp. N022]